MTGWMLCVITHIREDLFKKLNINHMIKVNNGIKTLFAGSYEKELYETLDMFWSEYKKAIIKLILLTVMNLSGVVKIFVM